MRLDLTSFLHGSVRCEYLGTAPVPRRLTAVQESLLAADPIWPRCARGCSGIDLRLRTDASFIDLRLRLWGDTRPGLGLDVEVDGRWTQSWREEIAPGVIERRVFECQDRGSPTWRMVRIHLPIGLEVAIEDLVVNPGARCEAVAAFPRRMLCLGDSITQGHKAISPASTWAAQLARLQGSELLNQGVAGHIWHPDFLDAVPEIAPDLVIVAYGINDWSRKEDADPDLPARIGERAADGLTRLRRHIASGRLVVLTPMWCQFHDQPRNGCRLESVRAAIAAAAHAAGAEVIDGAGILPADPWWCADGLHPNEAGMGIIATRLHAAIA
jgi:lysophospholipase L1-like esterase